MNFGLFTGCALEMSAPGIVKEIFKEAVAPKYQSSPELPLAVAGFSICGGNNKQGLKNKIHETDLMDFEAVSTHTKSCCVWVGILILQANPSDHVLIWNSNRAVYCKLIPYNNQ